MTDFDFLKIDIQFVFFTKIVAQGEVVLLH